jgi:hypothetical protein
VSVGLEVRGAVTAEELAALLTALHGSAERAQPPSTYEAWRVRRLAAVRPARTRNAGSR